jgi:polyisoprenyl-teichoic acid--peptidoglycan teichoic acid transferase
MIRRRLAVMVLVVLQVILLATASVAAAARWTSLSLPGGTYTLLVMGSDMGPYRSGTVFDGRADTLQLIVIDESRTKVTIVSFPRDTWVPVRGRGNARINELLRPGPEAAMGTIQDLTGLTVDDWIVTTFAGFIFGIDDFGGVNVNVETRLNNTGTGSGADRVVLEPGPQLLEGREALGYSRDRKSRPGGDFGRTAAAGTMLQSLHRDLIERAESPVDLVQFVAALRSSTESSLSTDRLLRLASLAVSIDPDDVVQVTVPGRAGMAGSASVVFMSDSAQQIFAELRQHGSMPAHR